MTWEKFWSIIDRIRAKADMQDEASVKQFLYTELINLPQDELLGFDCAWQSYRNKANFPKMVAAACIINDGSSDDRFTDFRNWLIMQGYDAYRQALIDPDNLAALNIPFRDTEWMGCGNVAWYAYAGQQLRTYFEKAGIERRCRKRGAHTLRHSLATTMLANNTPVPVITGVLGHASSRTTQKYLSIDVDGLRKVSLEVPE